MDAGDVEGLAVATYERHGLDPREPASPRRLVRAVLGPDAIIRVPNLRGQPAILSWVNGAPRIAVRKSLAPEYQDFFILHELGHYLLQQLGYDGDEEERFADLFAGCAMAPRPAVLQLHRAFGFDLESIAAEAASTETWAALRLGEVLRVPLAVVAPRAVRVRGPEEWVWPAETELRRIARDMKPYRGLVKTRLSDDPRRTVLLVDEASGGE